MQTAKPAIDSLTGLRFIAALTVFIHHLGGKFGIGMNPYSIGSAAVTFFFVLSGFILVYVYHDRLNNSGEIKRFYFNRFARIWPLHLTCLIIAIVTFGNLRKFEDQETWWQLLANLGLVQSWFSEKDWVFAFNGVSWSISTEAFFYLVFPLLAFSGGKRLKLNLTWMVLLVIGAIIGLNHLSHNGTVPTIDLYRVGQVNPLIRLPDFLIGVMAGFVFLKRQSNVEPRPHQFWVDTVQEVMVLAAIVVTCIWVSNEKFQQRFMEMSWGSEFLGSWFRVEYPILLFGFAVYVFAKSRGLIARIMANRILVYLGDISYAFYMIHYLVIRNIYLSHESYGSMNGWLIGILAFFVSLGMSIILYELIEIPTKSLLNAWYDRKGSYKKPNPRRWVVARSMMAVVMFAGPLWYLSTNITTYQRPDAVKKIIRNSNSQTKNINFGSHIRLLGVEVNEKKKKLELKFAWLKKTDMTHRRLVFVIDKNQKQVARGQHNQEAIENALPGQTFVDVAHVPLEALKPGHEIIVCFRSKDASALPVDKGDRRRGNKALVIPHKYKRRVNDNGK